MKKYLFIVFLITIFNSLIADTPFSVRRDNVKVFTSPNFENEIPSMEYFYGDTISITLYSDPVGGSYLVGREKRVCKKREPSASYERLRDLIPGRKNRNASLPDYQCDSRP